MSSMPMLASSGDAPPATLPVEWIERLFGRLGAIFGAKLADGFAGVPLADVKREWGEALAEFRPEEIRRGIEECRTRRWPPMLGEFLLLCRPALDPEQAWHEAVDGLRARDRGELGVWSHPAVWRAATSLSPEVRNGSYHTHRAAWAHALKRELRAGWGEDVPMPRPTLPPPPATPASPERVQDALASMRGLLDAAARADECRQWRWAQRLMEAHQSGRRRTTATILRMAAEVLETYGALPADGRRPADAAPLTSSAAPPGGAEQVTHPDEIASGDLTWRGNERGTEER